MSLPQKTTPPNHLSSLLDFLPLIAFFAAYKLADLQWATAALMVATLISLGGHYVISRKLALSPLLTALVVGIFGGLTLWLDDEFFIKIKPTIINTLFAIILLVGVYGFRQGLLRHLLGLALQMQPEGWLKLSRNWGIYFLFLAGLNEFIWRNYSTDFWVSFKVFGMLVCTIAFTISQIPLILKYQEK